MVKLQRRLSKKRYLNSKRVYEYERLSVDIPKKYHRVLAGLLSCDFDLTAKVENGTVVMTSTPKKTHA